MAERRFTWLHLTDLHVGNSLGTAEWPGAEYNVLEDIKRCISLVRERVDAIIFTGDLTQKATDDEFRSFGVILENIRNAIGDAGGGRPPFLAVPGNHDLDRAAGNESVAEWLRDLEQRPGLRDGFWRNKDNEYRKSVRAAFEPWTKWSETKVDWASFADVRREDAAEHPGEFAVTFEGDDYLVGILGLNTAATQLLAGDYEGKLTMNGLQATSLLGRPHEWSKRHDACLLLTHHPPSWLDVPGNEAYRNHVAHPDWFDLHLCGHCHEQERIRVFRGGKEQLRLLLGRSLFGLEEFGEAGSRQKRLFGYSFGQIAFGDTRQLRFWPRADQPKQRGTWVIEADHSEDSLDPVDGVTPVDDLGPSHRESVAAEARPQQPLLPQGWDLVDADFLDASAASIRPDDVSEYFDGEDPEWPVIASGRISQRALVGDLLGRLTATETAVVSAHLVVGPGGEGKTTVVMQVAAALGCKEGWHVLWRRSAGYDQPGRLHWDDLSSHVHDETALCLIIDEAHEVRGEIRLFMRRDRIDTALRGKSGASIHLVLCAHEDDWARRRLAGDRWRAEELPIGNLSKRDALEIIRGYRNERALGALDSAETDDALAELLVTKARSLSTTREAALLGALIEARTGESMDLHVERILVRTVQAKADTGLPVVECFISTAAANAVGLHRLREDVLCEAVQYNEQEVGDAIRVAGAELRIEGFGAGRTVRVRHGAIARRAVQLSFSARPTDQFFFDKARVFKSLSRATVMVVPEFWQSPSAFLLLDLSVSLRKTDPQIAVAIAEGAVEGASDNIHLRSRLAQTYREVEAPDPYAAEATCREFLTLYPGELANEAIRHLVIEWAVASGECKEFGDHGARSVWLALLAFSDQCGGETVSKQTTKHLPTITKGLTLVGDDLPRDVVTRAAAAIFATGRAIPGTPHLGAAQEVAGEAFDTVPVGDLGSALCALSQAAWDLIEISFRDQEFSPMPGALTFEALTRRVTEVTS